MEIRPSSVVLQGVFVELISAPRVVGNGGGNGGGVVILGLPYAIELPNVVVRTLRSTVMLPDKGTLLIGGFTTSIRQRTHTGIPFLSHIPFLGRLFSRNGTYDANRRLYFLLNAEIVDLAEKEALQ
jgi:Flp pilus assembly secretin CpaC